MVSRGQSPLKKAAATVAAAASSLTSGSSESAVLPAPPRPGEQYILELDGQPVGSPATFEGGHAYMDPVSSAARGRYPRKRPGPVQYEHISLTVPLEMAPAFWSWITAALGPRPEVRDGAITAIDGRGQVLSRLEFRGAAISELRFPALDAASREAAAISIDIAPQVVETVPATGTAPMPSLGHATKRWVASNFQFHVDGLDLTIAKVSKVEAIAIACGRTPSDAASIANFAAVMPQTSSEPFAIWLQESMQKAGSRKSAARDVVVTYLAPDLATPLGTLKLSNAGILKLAPEKAEGRSSKARTMQATFYVETIRLDVPHGAG